MTSQLKRFSNKVQLLRHISKKTGIDIDILWDSYDEQIDNEKSK
jgi:hypothetical protein